jgi:hypothetical protein
VPAPPKLPLRPGLAAKQPPASEDALAKSKREKDELEGECQKLEEELEELKARYEQYFLGVERKEPVRWREEMRKRVLRVKEAFTRNTGLRFRLQSLHARYLSYERLWLKSAREKEEGTYRRDLLKARLRSHRGEPAPAPPEKAAAAKAAGAATPEAMGAAQMRALYNAYVAAKKSCNEDVSRLTYDAVANSVSKQVPEIMTRFKAKSVEFKVEVKNGKAVLKAIPKV